MQITLKAARVNQNLTQKQAAEKLGVSRTTLQSWEKGKTYPTADKFQAIRSLYGFEYDEIFFTHC